MAGAGLLDALEAVIANAAGKVVVCLPDLYMDTLVSLPRWADTQKLLASAALRGGGRIRSGGERLVVGGNAFNTAHALARLGLRARFAARTSAAALEFARREAGTETLDLSLVRDDGRTSMSVALEMGPERTNVQLNDPGSLDGLRLEDLGQAVEQALRGAAAVHIANWGQNVTAGSEFVAEVLRASKAAHALTFLDPSDLWGREKDTLGLLRGLSASKELDWFLVNEAELRELARVLLLNAGGTSPCAHDDLEGQAREFTKRVPGGLAVHTAAGSQAWQGGRLEGASKAPPITPQRTTGAGDVWNAGFIAATLAGIRGPGRLEFAQHLAGLFVAGTGPPPTADDFRRSLAGP